MLETSPVLSFVVPVYKKSPDVFRKCLESLFGQTFKDFEVICVFDGPDEELQKVAEGFPVKSVVIEHGGACKARNEGFTHSKGRFVSFWDADCFAKEHMAKRWMEEFEATGADFVYSGYEFEGEQGGYESETFSPYSLTCGNYIATMFPMKREVFPGFDETLEAGQDWDLWLTIVENGGKGSFIQGYGWSTEASKQGSISYEGWAPGKRDETISKVRAKHKIQDRRIVFCSMRYQTKCIDLGKMCDGDVLKGSSYGMDHYDVVFNLGYGPFIRFDGARADAVKVHYWLPWDIECLFEIAYRTSKETIRLAKEEITHNFVGDHLGKKKLAELGISAEVLPLPSDTTDLEHKLPEKFRVLVDSDKTYRAMVDTLKLDMPYVDIDYIWEMGNAADITRYTTFISLYEFPAVDEGIRRAMLNGRHIISNVQAPYCGYIDMKMEYEAWKREIIRRVRESRELPFNADAQKYAVETVNPQKFRDAILPLLPTKLEVA